MADSRPLKVSGFTFVRNAIRYDYPIVEAVESMTDFPEGAGHPQGAKKFNGKLHQCYGHQYVSKVEGKKLKVVHKTKIEDSLYEPEADYTKQPL